MCSTPTRPADLSRRTAVAANGGRNSLAQASQGRWARLASTATALALVACATDAPAPGSSHAPLGSAPALSSAAAVSAPGASAPVAALVDIDALWDFSSPARSEARFRDAQARATPIGRLLLQTQIARTYGMRRDFAQARQLLQAQAPQVAATTASLDGAASQPGDARIELRVRQALELGRTHASAAHREQEISDADRETARRLFLDAAQQAAAARLDALAIDALHMMVFVDTAPAQQIAWNRRALDMALRSDQPRGRRWEGSLQNNLGWALQEQGDLDAAVQAYRASRAAYARDGRTQPVRFADWMIARVLRLQGRLREALAIQLELERAWDADGAPDPEVFEELELLHRALGDEAQAQRAAARRKALPS